MPDETRSDGETDANGGSEEAEEPRGAPVSFPRRRWVVPALVVVLVLAALIGLGHKVYAEPTVQTLAPGERLDAVVGLGGLVESASYAQSVAASGQASVLVLSNPYGTSEPVINQACASRPSTYRVICFVPDPSTTRGEAREIRRLAEANGWKRVAVVVPVYHISRARMIVKRCYTGQLLMLETPAHTSPAHWVYQYLYQTAGFIKATILQGC